MGQWAHWARPWSAPWVSFVWSLLIATPCFALGSAAEQDFSNSLLLLSTLPLPSGSAVIGALRGASDGENGTIAGQPGFTTAWRSPAIHGLSMSVQVNAFSKLVRAHLAPPEFSLARLNTFAPEPLALQRLTLDYEAGYATTIRMGTQELNSEPPGWGPVTMVAPLLPWTGVSVKNTHLPRTTLFGAHVSRVMDARGTLIPAQIDTVRATYQWHSGHQVMGYGYFSDVEGGAVLARENRQTLGLRADGIVPVNDAFGVRYLTEWAWQSAATAETQRVGATFRRAAAGVAWRGGFARADIESLPATELPQGFSIPLGTNALASAWPLVMPSLAQQGLRAAGATLGGAYGESRWSVQLRDYRNESSASRLGSEWAFGWSHWMSKNLNWRIDYADVRWNADVAPAMRRLMFAVSYQRRN